MMANVNYLSVLVCGVAAMIVGYVWYGPLFGKLWMKEGKISTSQAKKANMTGMYVLMYVSAVIEAYVLSVVLGMMGNLTYASAATGAFWVWLGFMATVMVGMVTAEGKSWTYYAVVAGYQLVIVLVMSAIIVAL
ncbi:MAG TPA: DUF1761 domain-containing protein [Patescibacteria group bacterium]|nr:DUF1761 domain-containing protein [Patescibacteria group bacterium]